MSVKTDLIIVHSPCRDGYTAELCARLYYKRRAENSTKPVEDIPNSDISMVNDFEVWGVEPNSETCLKMLKERTTKFINSGKKINNIRIFDLAIQPDHANYLVGAFDCTDIEIYDHHKTFKEAWNEYKKNDPAMYSIWEDKLHYDVSHCGAYLAWQYYFPGTDVPAYILYVEDRDLWRFDAPNSVEINEALFCNHIKYGEHEEYLKTYFQFSSSQDENRYYDTLAEVGKSLINAKNRRMETLYKTGYFIKFDGYKIFACNASHMDASDLGNFAVTKGDCDAAFLWRYVPETNTIGISVRTDNKNPNALDASELCKKYGGGGHKNAAGFEIPARNISLILREVPN